jgi:hypothetical protein
MLFVMITVGEWPPGTRTGPLQIAQPAGHASARPPQTVFRQELQPQPLLPTVLPS